MRKLGNILVGSAWLAFGVSFEGIGQEGLGPLDVAGIQHRVETRVARLLQKYCGQWCELLAVKTTTRSSLSNSLDLGFEELSEDDADASIALAGFDVTIQVDSRVLDKNRQRLSTIIRGQLEGIAPAQVHFTSIEAPQIDMSASNSVVVQESLKQRVKGAVDAVFKEFCPDACILSYVAVKGSIVGESEASGLDQLRIYRSSPNSAPYRNDHVRVAIAIDAGLGVADRRRIVEILKSKTSFIRPLDFAVEAYHFPESFVERQRRERQSADDPHGLDKLRQMLTIFRDLAGTREIISKSSHTESSNFESASKATSSTQESNVFTQHWQLWVFGILVLVLLVAVLFTRLAGLRKDANFMVANTPQPRNASGLSASSQELNTTLVDSKQDRSKKLEVEALRDELRAALVDSSKLAHETFVGLVQDEGIEETAKYLHILGKVVVMELVDEPSMQRIVYELCEYYQRSKFSIALNEEADLLDTLRARMTATELRILAQKNSERFDFLNKLDPSQIYTLIREETPRLQGIVLTQLSPTHRRTIFNTFDGDARSELLRELSRSDAIPKEYLKNVAQALSRKVKNSPAFDTYNVRASDVLLDLMERSTLEEQRQLMYQLEENNPDTAQALKTKLITVETLAYVNSGHLLELVLGVDREDFLIFLAGTREHVRKLILSHSPSELTDSWLEDLETTFGVDEKRYLSVESSILNRVRSMVADGQINLIAVNESLFTAPASSQATLDAEIPSRVLYQSS